MKDAILVVDDDGMNIRSIKQVLKDRCQVATATSGQMALKILERMTPDLILLEINMPMMDGFQLMKILREQEHTANIPVIFITAEQGDDIETKALEAGAIDFVNRPFQPSVLLNRIFHALEIVHYKNRLEMMVKIQADEIVDHVRRINRIQKEVIISMANLIESRDGSTGGHVKRTCMYVESLVKAMLCKEKYQKVLTKELVENLCNAAYLHDIGKIKVSDSILQKPGKLTEDEYEKMKEHAKNGGEIIRNILEGIEDEDYIDVAQKVSMYHHERWDGTGYPEGLKGEEIPLSARIMAIADVFDALTSKRCYKQAMRLEDAYQVMKEMSGTYFDPDILEIFLENFDGMKLISNSYQ